RVPGRGRGALCDLRVRRDHDPRHHLREAFEGGRSGDEQVHPHRSARALQPREGSIRAPQPVLRRKRRQLPRQRRAGQSRGPVEPAPGLRRHRRARPASQRTAVLRVAGGRRGQSATIATLPLQADSAWLASSISQAEKAYMIPTERPVPDREGPRDECGVFGVYAPRHDVARLAYFGLYALQHRGQESAGIATCEGGHITTLRETGLVSQVFDEEKLRALEGDMAIGHVRYSTTGGGSWENTQPVWRDDGRELALAHNGNLTNAVELWGELKQLGIDFRGTSDSEIIAALLSSHDGKTIEDAVEQVMPRLEGAYSTVVMTKHAIVAFRDPHGIR